MRRMTGSIVVLALAAFGFPACAEDAPAKKTLETKVAVGATFNDGNTESSQFNASVITEGENDIGSFKAGLEGNYADNTTEAGEDETTKKDARLFGNVKKTFTERTYGYLDGSVLYDDIADIDYRVTVGPGLGAYAVKSEQTRLYGETGVAYIWEQVAGENDSYPTLRVAEGFEHKFGDKGKIWESVEWLPEFSDFGKYLLNAEIGAEAALNTRLNLRVVLQDRYDSEPAEGHERNDLTTIVGLSSKF